jgi:hypothetical protein
MAYKEDLLYSAFLAAVQETERDEFSDEEEELEEQENVEATLLGFLALSEQRYLVPRVYNVAKSFEWREKILPAYDEERFKKLFRMSRHSFSLLADRIRNDGAFISRGNKEQAPVELQLAVFLRRLGTMEDIFSICSHFGIAEGTVILYSKRVMKALRHLQSELVKWPRGERRKEVHEGFQKLLGIPNIIGAIDGTHIILANAPKNDPETFFNRKKQYSVQCQAIVDADGIFTDFLVGWPGSVHDARVYQNSDFLKNRSDYIMGDDFILADSAYPISPFCITPFKPARTSAETDFNLVHSRHRVVIENAFGRLKARFVVLRNVSAKSVKSACELAACAIMLHNFLELEGEIWPETYVDDVIENDIETISDLQNDNEARLKVAGQNKRRQLLTEFILK